MILTNSYKINYTIYVYYLSRETLENVWDHILYRLIRRFLGRIDQEESGSYVFFNTVFEPQLLLSLIKR
jgi:hypothetical protein